MGYWDGMGETEIYEKGVYLTPNGSYELEVKNILLKDTRKSGLGFIVEFEVIEATGEGGEKHPTGSKATWFQKMADKDVAFPAVKQFFASLLQVDMNDPEAKEEFNNTIEETVAEATAPVAPKEEHPLAGERIHVDTYTKLTKKGLEFTAHNWSFAHTAADAA